MTLQVQGAELTEPLQALPQRGQNIAKEATQMLGTMLWVIGRYSH